MILCTIRITQTCAYTDEDLEHFLLKCQLLETTRQVTIHTIDKL